jgi:hypothetical protein
MLSPVFYFFFFVSLSVLITDCKINVCFGNIFKKMEDMECQVVRVNQGGCYVTEADNICSVKDLDMQYVSATKCETILSLGSKILLTIG